MMDHRRARCRAPRRVVTSRSGDGGTVKQRRGLARRAAIRLQDADGDRLRWRRDRRQISRDRGDVHHRAAGAGQGVAFVMMTGGLALRASMMVGMMAAMIVRRSVGVHIHYGHRWVLCRRKRDQRHLLSEAWRGSVPQRQRDARAEDAKQIGKGDQPPRHHPNCPRQSQRHAPRIPIHPKKRCLHRNFKVGLRQGGGAWLSRFCRPSDRV
jgi:hypothetical protein